MVSIVNLSLFIKQIKHIQESGKKTFNMLLCERNMKFWMHVIGPITFCKDVDIFVQFYLQKNSKRGKMDQSIM